MSSLPKPSRSMVTSNQTIKFLCSYGGKILPRYPDGKLRYHGGETRVLAVDRSISFAELLVKLGELCGKSVCLRCQLPTEDLDALVSVTSDEDLANLIEEYDRVASPPASLKIRAFLSPPKSIKKISPPPSSASSSQLSVASASRFTMPAAVDLCHHQISPQVPFQKSSRKVPHYGYHVHGNPSHVYLIHNGNHWQ
ncbi:hypothetical protein VitviT2T_000629 [Vitis vinifera]|uniref:PB1 domain-containing protein n=3 Tax=Vitis vinifera TaxID=29760 RepID=A0ABY9BEI9_VITVI|nr:hypothetical protein VitviT2T_000629 [Vitis vinifera]